MAGKNALTKRYAAVGSEKSINSQVALQLKTMQRRAMKLFAGMLRFLRFNLYLFKNHYPDIYDIKERISSEYDASWISSIIAHVRISVTYRHLFVRLPVNSDLLKLGPTNLDLLGIIQTRTETNSARKSYELGPQIMRIRPHIWWDLFWQIILKE